MTQRAGLTQPGVIPSPNLWRWPATYEAENKAQDADGALAQTVREVADWYDRDVLDIGCGAGFHLPMFAADARSVLGVEPHQSLVALARRASQGSRNDDGAVRIGADASPEGQQYRRGPRAHRVLLRPEL